MAKKATKKSAAEDLPFEESLAELETIVDQLEHGDLGLSEALANYEQGVGLLKSCHGILRSAERKIALLSGVDAEGNAITEPFDDEPTEDLDAKGASRAKRRTTSAKKTTQKPEGKEVDDTSRLF